MILTFPMWFDGHKRLLGDILHGLPEDIEWRMKWFDGSVLTGREPPPINTPINLVLSSADLLALADSLTDLDEVVLDGCLGGVKFQIEGQDSTRWVVTCPSEIAATAESWFRAFSPVRF